MDEKSGCDRGDKDSVFFSSKANDGVRFQNG